MDYILGGIRDACSLLLRFDAEVYTAGLLSLRIALTSTFLAMLAGIPLGSLIATREFRGKKLAMFAINTLMALPTVVVGLLVYSFVSRRGPCGRLELLFTPAAMIIGQFILALPIVTGFTASALTRADRRIGATALTLGATRFRAFLALLHENSPAVCAAGIAAFGRVFAEIGISIMLGGNIRNYTRTLTTAIAFETQKGEFALGIALGILLLAVAFTVNLAFQILRARYYEPV